MAHEKRPLKLCSVCEQINIESITPPRSFPLHANLHELRRCFACFLCRKASSDSSNSHSNKGAPHLAKGSDHLYQVRAMLGKAQSLPKGRPMLRFKLSRRLENQMDSDFVYRSSPMEELLEVYTNRDDPAASIIPWLRRVGEHTASSTSLALARSWISRCSRGQCLGDDNLYEHVEGVTRKVVIESNLRERPGRLVKIAGDACSLQLAEGNQCPPSYVALSYVWGKHEATWRMTLANLAGREMGFDVRQLPQTLRDAVHITHSLGYDLLWIDCLCIVQDDPDEWMREAAKMALIFKHAVVTISADVSRDSKGGICNSGSSMTTRLVRTSNSLSDGRQSVLYLVPRPWTTPRPDFDDSPVSKRAWCLQEHIAAWRILYFCEMQLFWQCIHCSQAEDNIARKFHPRRTSEIVLFGESSAHKSTPDQLLSAWYRDLVRRDYSHRALTFLGDRLNAIAGIAAAFYKLGLGQYFAGHWEHSFLASLCWKPDRYNDCNMWDSERAAVVRAPSWSWVSPGCSVVWFWDALENFAPSAVVLEVHAAANAANSLGEVTCGFPKVRAYRRRARLENTNVVFENGDCNMALIDTFQEFPRRLVAILLGFDSARTNRMYSLLLLPWQTDFVRIGLVYAHYDDDPASFQEALETWQQAPLEDLTII